MINPVTLVLVDEHTLVRQGLRLELEQTHNLTVVAEVCSAEQAIKITQQRCPNVVLSDTELPDRSGVEACRMIKAHCEDTAVVLLSTHDWDAYLARAWAAGANGFVAKTASATELIQTIQQAALGERQFTATQLQRIQRWQAEVEGRLHALTSREQAVLRQIALERTNAEIAHELTITLKTVETHVCRVLAKLEVRSRRDARTWATRTHALAAK